MTLAKHCPYCRHLIKIELGDRSGVCDRCFKEYQVKYHLTKIRLIQIFVPRDYETEILLYVARKGKTYAGEISAHIGVSKGLVSTTIRKLEEKRLITVIPRGKTKWIILPDSNIKIK